MITGQDTDHYFELLHAARHVMGGEHSLIDARRADSELERMKSELLAAQARNDSLALRIDSLLHDDGALERLARERYGLIRDGEYLYRMSGVG